MSAQNGVQNFFYTVSEYHFDESAVILGQLTFIV